uniref:Alkaline phosphatase n=1 Tax=Gongylonema pulchrum TaxID=637853 RepID=A0A183EYD6_9BILA
LSSDGSVVTADEVVRTEANAGADDFTLASSGTDGDDDIGRRVDLAAVVTADEVDGREAVAGTDEFNVGNFFGTSDNDAGGIGCNDDEVSGGAAG